MDYCRVIIASVVLLLPSVTGIQFQLSQNDINLGNPASDFVTLTCSMTVTPVKIATFIKIFMESISGSGWEQIAAIAGREDASFSSTLPTNIRSIMQVSGTLVTDPATNSQLVVSMNASLMTCLHARMYRCELGYLYGDNFDLRNEEENITLSATASPSTPHIETVKNLNTNQVINVANGDTSTLTIRQNEELEIVCSANIGSNENTIIQWDYSSSSGTWMIDFNGYKENGEAQADNSGGSATNCRYTRTSTIRHNISDIDAARGSSNPLIFSCYIQEGGVLTQNNPMYTITISHAKECVLYNPDQCSVVCPAGERKACEHGICTCSRICTLRSDCDACPTYTDFMGHVHHEQVHCINGACLCQPDGPMPGGVGLVGR